MACVGIVLPTVDGREEMAAACSDAYAADGAEVHIVTLRNRRTCGHAWNEGVAALLEAGVDFIHLTADDLLPRHPRVFDSAMVYAAAGLLPAPFLYDEGSDAIWNHQDGAAGEACAFSRVPFMSAAQARVFFPMPGLHYYSDCWIGSVGLMRGIRTVNCAGYAFTHLWAQPGRIHDSEPDRLLFEREIGRVKL